MSETKHTPGPWKVYGDYIVPASSKPNKYGMQSGEYIAQHYDTIGCGTKKANAHLIAAAPELLEACIEALYWLDVSSRGEEECAKKLQAAIDRAEGVQ